jgi:hypothetical protein
MTRKGELQHLKRLVGTWTTEGTHPARPGLVIRGTSTFEWLEGEQFLIQRARTDQPEFPASLTVTGFVDRDRDEPAKDDDATMAMHYYDSRGVFRTFKAAIDDKVWRMWNDSPGFAQRFTGTFADGGSTIVFVTQLCRDGSTWKDDLELTYRRSATP